MQLAMWLAQAAPQFPEQVTTSSLLQNVVYASGTVGAIVILAGLMLVDVGGVRRVNVFAAAAEKMIGFFIGFAVYFLIGFAIWNWQYYVAFEVDKAQGAARADVDVLVEDRTRLREERAELDRGRRVAAG